MRHSADIDIDLADRAAALRGLDCTEGVRNAEREKHASAVYFQNIPIHPLDGLAVWDHKEAERRGYFKLDFLSVGMYNGVRDEAHLVDLLTRPVPWEVFDDPNIVGQLAHVADHFDVVQAIRPRSIIDLAICIALIRPGKRYLTHRSRAEIDRDIWVPTTAFYYKKSHSIAYASAIVVQLNLLLEQRGQV
jgi:hypothetical protein